MLMPAFDVLQVGKHRSIALTLIEHFVILCTRHRFDNKHKAVPGTISPWKVWVVLLVYCEGYFHLLHYVLVCVFKDIIMTWRCGRVEQG